MIALVDCNNFYASCERLFRPSLEGKPVVILSNKDGCVIARSNEAKAMGIQMGAPAFMMEKMLAQNQVAVFSSNYTLYGNISNRVMQTLYQFAPAIEIYSIDEAFLDLTQLKYTDLLQLAQTIRDTIMNHIGIPVTVGIAPTKTLAKMANRYAKKECKKTGVYFAETAAQIEQLLIFTDVVDIWGIGSQHCKKLLTNKIFTAYDLVKVNEEWIRKNLTVTGQRMWNELKAMQCIDWEECPPPKKGICTARSFGQLLTQKKDLKEAVANHANNCAAKLRKQKSCAGLLQVFIQTNTHRTQDKQYFKSVTLQLPTATNNAAEIIGMALKGLDLIFKPGYNFKKAGVMLLELVPDEQVQLNFFEPTNRSNDEAIMKVYDHINTKYGRDMVRYAVQGYNRKWKLKQQKLSPSYTTDIRQVLTIECNK